jgi:hypothetical protein
MTEWTSGQLLTVASQEESNFLDFDVEDSVRADCNALLLREGEGEGQSGIESGADVGFHESLVQLTGQATDLIADYVYDNATIGYLSTLGVVLRATAELVARSDAYAGGDGPGGACGSTCMGLAALELAESGDVSMLSSKAVGGYCDGSNANSARRKNFGLAYAQAVRLGYQVVRVLEEVAAEESNGVYPARAQRSTSVQPEDRAYTDTLTDLSWMYRLAVWSSLPNVAGWGNGHWKGPGSGYPLGQAIAVEKYANVRSLGKTRFYDPSDSTTRGMLAFSYPVLEDSDDSADPDTVARFAGLSAVPTLLLVDIMIVSFEANVVSSGAPDLYAVWSLGGQDFVEAPLNNVAIAKEGQVFWRASKVVAADADVIAGTLRIYSAKGLSTESHIPLAVGEDGDEVIAFNLTLGATPSLSGDVTASSLDDDISMDGDDISFTLRVKVTELVDEDSCDAVSGACEVLDFDPKKSCEGVEDPPVVVVGSASSLTLSTTLIGAALAAAATLVAR